MRVRSFLAGAIVFGALVIAGAQSARAQTVITFDDLNTSPNYVYPLYNGYEGFNWSNFGVDSDAWGAHGRVSGQNYAWNGYGDDSAMLESVGTFTLNSLYLTAYDRNYGLTLRGYNGSNQVYSQVINISNTNQTFVNLDWTGITKVEFDTPQSGLWFMTDNMTVNGPVGPVVPEGDATALLAMGGLPIIGIVLRNRRKAAARS